MKVLLYSAKPFEIPLVKKANNGVHFIEFTPKRLTSETAQLALNFDAISIFSADDASEIVLKKLQHFGIKFISLRSAGFDNINTNEARRLGIKIANTPDYSPYAIAEHGIALLLTYNRRIIEAQRQMAQNNFLLDNLIGFDLHRKKVGVLGTGRIGSVLVKILNGFGCDIQANDTVVNKNLVDNFGVKYVSKDAICKESEIIFICLPLTESTHHLIDSCFLNKIKNESIIVNIARGAIVDTVALLEALDDKKINGYVADVYEKERGIFFYDHSQKPINDILLQRLLVHPKVLLTPHQAFATKEALQNISETTIVNLNVWAEGKHSVNEIC